MFYDNYVKLCNSIGKSPSAVAVEVGIYKSTVSNWKNRGTSPTDATAQRIADYFGVSVAELCGGQKENPTVSGGVKDAKIEKALSLLSGMTEAEKQLAIERLESILSGR